jgi:DNA polymerase-1
MDTPDAPRHRHNLYLIDGSGYIFRAFHALPPLNRPDGTPVNAVLGFTNMLVRLLDDVGADRIAVIFDAGRTTFRNDIYPEYKANRDEPPPELIPQFALIKEATRAFNVPAIELEGFEADDLIASYAAAAVEAGDEVTIVSSDKDLMQLVRDHVRMLDPMKNRKIGPDEVIEKFGVRPDKVVDVQALCGDSVDNVPGIRGIGIKTAAELINQYGTLDELLARAAEIKQPKRRESLIEGAEMARISRELVRLKADVPLPMALDAFVKRAPDQEVLQAFLAQQGFRTLMNRLGADFTPKGERAGAHVPALTVETAREPERPYELVQDLAALERWIERATLAGAVAVDTETTSLDTMVAELVGVSLALGEGDACYIPLGHVAPDGAGGGGQLDFSAESGPKQIKLADALAKLSPLLEDPSVLKIGHNIKYDAEIFARYNIELGPVDDTMLLSYALEGGLHGHGMDELAALHFGHETIKYKDVAGTGKGHIGFARVALDKALHYAAEDADITWRLHERLKPRLLADRMVTVYETIERPLIPIIAAMEREGVKVDRTGLKRLSGDFAQKLAGLEDEIHRLAGHPFNVGSPKQLGVVLFEELKLPGGKRGKNGDYSTDSGVLEPIAAAGNDLAARVLDWRQISKLKSTYADALVEQINPDTGRIHTSFSMAAASTGRLSSTDPNLQNIPVRTEEGRKIRSTFIAEAGWKLLSVDYSQIELRLLAEMADIQSLKDAFRDGVDIHALTASQVFGIPLEQMDKETRRKAKAINFGIIYGISAFGLGAQLGVPSGEASAFIKAYFERYPGIRAYMDSAKAYAREHGFVKTLFGRKIHMPGIADSNQARRAFAERQAINAPIQGSAADIMKRAMLRVPGALREAGLKARMVLTVHDELLFEVPVSEIDATSSLVRSVMEAAGGLTIPLVAEAGVGDTWAEAH